MSMIRFEYVTPHHPDVQPTVAKLDEDLLLRYPPEDIFGMDFNDPHIDEVQFVLAYDDETPVGCGAIRPLTEGMTELKRFFVDAAYRQQGIAAMMLAKLESLAIEQNYTTIRLETGDQQPESIHFYKKYGFYEIERFGQYADSEGSLCFEKIL
ncbi:GNAT family N-acetyltransferase [Paenibacillus sp. SC116]|uniref:GNAT family N-acetyltransferase n=1 Tax=Paenibacillus sp. SC116 TaxID=2968986 RepID=UPI00215B62A2|nr:GNAT family N-acetyltransferase [Paenibacillus sp. SC116]MCR8845872.1 GNAT family N-acetyltransferase [Paenibacillus sp. SC116]